MKIFYILLVFISLLHSKELEKVSVQLTWKHQFSFAGVYTAKKKGYYEEVGLDLEIKDANFDGKLFDNIETGKSTYSIMTSDVSLFQYEGKKIALLSSYLKRNILVFITKPHIKKVEDLKGKKVIDNGYMFRTALYVLMKQHGLKKDDITLVKRDHKNYVNDFVSDPEIVAITGYLTGQIYDFKKAGVDINIINPSEYGIYTYGLNLFTSENEINKNFERTKKFMEATNKGWEYAFKNKKEIVDLIHDKYSSLRSKEAIMFEAVELEKLFQPNLYKIGEVQPELQEMNLNLFKKIGLIDKDWYPPKYIFAKDDYNYYIYIGLFIISLILGVFIYRNYSLKGTNKVLLKEIEKEVEKNNEQSKMIYHQNKMVSMGEMIDNIAHQWRQPLSQINSIVFKLDDQINSKEIDKEKIEDKLSEIEMFTSYMSNTIEDFSNFVKKDKEKELFELSDTINNALKIIDNIVLEYNLNIKLDLDDTIYLEGFKGEFQQIFLILINNSKDAFIEKDIITREVKIISKQLNENIFIDFYDNAGGIDKTIEEKIFEPYFSSKTKGTGIGLSIVKMIIENSMNGNVSFNNIKNGAHFCISLPRKKDEN